MDHWLFQEKRKFSKFEAWVDLLLMANYKDAKTLLGSELVEIKRGSFITSELKLMERWSWSKTKVRAFLGLLESEQMIIKTSDRKKTTITLCNYSDYQTLETTKKPPEDYGETTKRHNEESKELKEVKKEKIAVAEHVRVSQAEYDQLVDKLGEDLTQTYIERLDNYIGSKGKRYKSHYRTILTWVDKDNQKAGVNNVTPNNRGISQQTGSSTNDEWDAIDEQFFAMGTR